MISSSCGFGVRNRGGRIEVSSDCTVTGHPEISAIGDMASHVGVESSAGSLGARRVRYSNRL
jgi:NADH dehydrogenase FAD-containing subunit